MWLGNYPGGPTNVLAFIASWGTVDLYIDRHAMLDAQAAVAKVYHDALTRWKTAHAAQPAAPTQE